MKISGNSQHKLLSDCSSSPTSSPKTPLEPLGVVLQQAGLISSRQVKIALEKQQREYHHLPFGKILALQGWLKPETADFFAERWFTVSEQQPKQRLGQYFKEAALLDDFQIEVILFEQGQTKLKFGELAVRKGWIEPTTLEFFVKNFTAEPQSPSNLSQSLKEERIELEEDSLQREREIHRRFLKIRLRLFELDEDSFPPSLLEEVMKWTRGHFFLTQKLCQLAAETKVTIGEETQKIEQLVRTQIVADWENGAAAKHLTEMRDRLLHNRQCQPLNLIREYRRIYLQQTEFDDDSAEQTELIALGLISESRGKLKVSNRIYREVFDLPWIEGQLSKLFQQSEPTASRNFPTIYYRSALVASQASTSAARTKRQNRPLSWSILLVFAGLLGIGIPYILQHWQVRTLFQESTRLLTTGKYQSAIAGYNKLLNIDSNYYQAWTNRGYAFSGLEEYEQMLASCSSATLIEPRAIYAWNCRGEALHNLQRSIEAVEAFDQAIEIAPNDSVFFINKSEALITLEQYDEAIVASERAIEILQAREKTVGKNKVARELAIAWNYKARSLLEQREYQAAIAAYDRALEYVAQYFPAQIGKGIALKNLQKYRQASAVFRDILSNVELSETQKAETWFYIGKTLCASSQFLSGITAFERSLNLQPNYEAAKTAKANCG